MLVLARRRGEGIKIGDNLELVVDRWTFTKKPTEQGPCYISFLEIEVNRGGNKDKITLEERVPFQYNDEIVLKYLSQDRNQVKIEIQAPRDTLILRSELLAHTHGTRHMRYPAKQR